MRGRAVGLLGRPPVRGVLARHPEGRGRRDPRLRTWSVKEQEKDIELWYKSFASRLGLKEQQLLLFAHTGGGGGGRSNFQAPRSLDKFKFLNTTLDNEDVSKSMRDAFTAFLGPVAAAAMDKSSADMDASLASFG